MFMEPIYKFLIEHGVKILIYSGDDDGVIFWFKVAKLRAMSRDFISGTLHGLILQSGVIGRRFDHHADVT